MATLRSVLTEWLNEEVTIVNPHSFSETVLKQVIRMETYTALIKEIGEDFIRVHFAAPRKNVEAPVDQVIPFHEIRRVSVWGEDKLIHL